MKKTILILLSSLALSACASTEEKPIARYDGPLTGRSYPSPDGDVKKLCWETPVMNLDGTFTRMYRSCF